MDKNMLLAAASCASAAACDLVEEVRDGKAANFTEVASGETDIALADALRLLLDAGPVRDEASNQLHGALVRYLEERGA